MKKFAFINLSKEKWSNPRRARKQLLYKALLKQPAVEKVLYIEPPGHFGKSLFQQIPDPSGIHICERAYILKGERFALVRWINRLMVYLILRKHLKRELRWHTIFYNPWDISLAKLLSRHGPILFDWTEDWGVYYNNATLSAQQSTAINISSAIITVTETLADQACKYTNRKKNIFFLPNATAWKPASNLQCPIDMTNIPFPRIGYSGSLGPWFDRELVFDLSNARPDWHWVIVGHADQSVRDFFKNSSNIHLLGGRPFSSLQAYMAHCQVLVAPYQKKVGGDATKLYDYLTLGHPIVSTQMTTAQRLHPYVRMATDIESWLQALEESLSEKNSCIKRNRQQVSLLHTWDTRASVLLDWLEKLGNA